MENLSILETAMLIGAENHVWLTNIKSVGDIPAQLYDIILMIKAWRNNPDDRTQHTMSDGT